MMIYLLDYPISPATVDNSVNPLDGTEINDPGCAVSDDDSCGISCPPDFSDDSQHLKTNQMLTMK